MVPICPVSARRPSLRSRCPVGFVPHASQPSQLPSAGAVQHVSSDLSFPILLNDLLSVSRAQKLPTCYLVRLVLQHLIDKQDEGGHDRSRFCGAFQGCDLPCALSRLIARLERLEQQGLGGLIDPSTQGLEPREKELRHTEVSRNGRVLGVLSVLSVRTGL